MSLTRVNLNRDLVADDDVNPVRFLGEWAPGEPEGWETFTVMLHGSEAGDIVEASLSDLVEVLKQEGAVECDAKFGDVVMWESALSIPDGRYLVLPLDGDTPK